MGYYIRTRQRLIWQNKKINEELQEAYQKLALSHEGLQSYTELVEKFYKEMEQLAITDELTSLYNYRFLQSVLDRELSKPGPLSLIMLDIDHFKIFNDTYGHQQGNLVLNELAGILKSSVRDRDIVTRYGGEEFAIVLPATSREEAFLVAERIREKVEKHPFLADNGPGVKITISLGVAEFGRDAADKSQLISHADLALYQAKHSGRNRTCIYTKGN